MRMQRFVVLLIALLVLGSVTPAYAQFGFIKKGIEKLKDVRITMKGSTDNKDVEPEATSQVAAREELEDGETAVIPVELAVGVATDKVKAHFDNKEVDYTINPDTNRITTDWFGERRCGVGFNRCANRALVRVVADEAGNTTLRIQVMERKREGGLSPGPWEEGAKSKGKETSRLASELEAAFTQTVAHAETP